VGLVLGITTFLIPSVVLVGYAVYVHRSRRTLMCDNVNFTAVMMDKHTAS